MITLIILSIVIFILYIAYKLLSFSRKDKQKDVSQEEKHQEEPEEVENLEILTKENDGKPEEKPEQFYQLNVNKIKYLLYHPKKEGLDEIEYLYKRVVIENLWINEPFHSKFYDFLIMINDNELMIIDPTAIVITINTRGSHNQTQKSKTYQVYDTKQIIEFTIFDCIHDIRKFNKNDAQNILLSIMIFILKMSVHYLSHNVPNDIIKELLKDYEHNNLIEYILELVEENDEEIIFIKNSISHAFRSVETEPYNDTEVPEQLIRRNKLPKKFFQRIL